MWKGTASSEKATALNPTDAFSHQPQNHPARALVDTCPAEQMGSTTPSPHNTHTPQRDFQLSEGLLPARNFSESCTQPLKIKGSVKMKKNPLPLLSGAALASHLNSMALCLSHKGSQAREGPGPFSSPSKTLSLRKSL